MLFDLDESLVITDRHISKQISRQRLFVLSHKRRYDRTICNLFVNGPSFLSMKINDIYAIVHRGKENHRIDRCRALIKCCSMRTRARVCVCVSFDIHRSILVYGIVMRLDMFYSCMHVSICDSNGTIVFM
jgi:predicted PP-loop superfamily ATPase